jgi:hypothetical protein
MVQHSDDAAHQNKTAACMFLLLWHNQVDDGSQRPKRVGFRHVHEQVSGGEFKAELH